MTADAPILVAVAHGSRDPAAAATVSDLVDVVRRRRRGLVAVTAFLDHAEPALGDVLAGLRGPAVVVPLLLTAAYHSRVDVPAALDGAAGPVTQAGVLGPHPLLVAALERRLAEAGVRPGDPGTAVVLAAAGATDPRAVAEVREVAAGWAERGWWGVEAAFASAADPTVPAAVAALRARGAARVAVAAYLLAPGRFATGLAEAGADLVSAPLGAAPEVAEVVLARYDEARPVA